MKKGRRPIDPLVRLTTAFRAAALNIHVRAFRDLAAREAERIPETRIERANGGKAKVARQGRAIMKALPTMAPEDLAQAAQNLCDCADALRSDFYITSEVRFDGRRRSVA